MSSPSVSPPSSSPLPPPIPSFASVPVPTRQSTRSKHPPAWLKDFETPNIPSHPRANSVSSTLVQPVFPMFLCALLAQSDCTPTSFKEASMDPAWCEAMNAELKALELNGTWIVTSLPPGMKAIGCHWIFKTKLKADGTVDKKKKRQGLLFKAINKGKALIMRKPLLL